MSNFIEALVAHSKGDSIPTEFDFYGPLIGDWDAVWVDNKGSDNERRVGGEWLFSRTLEGMAV